MKSSKRYELRALLVVFSILIAPGCSTAPPEPTTEFQLTASIQDIMISMVDESADTIWESVATILTPGHIEERRPQTDEEWATLRRHAIILVEATNLLLMEGRRAAAEGVVSENPGLELEPYEIEERIAEDRQKWSEFVGDLHDRSADMLEAINEKDADKLFDYGGPLDVACENCHLYYWYPNEVKPWDRVPESVPDAEDAALSSPSVDAQAPPSEVERVAIAGARTGTIEGRVVLQGPPPGNAVIRMGRDPKCADINSGRMVAQESVLTGADGGLANVFVQLQGAFEKTPVPIEPVVVVQRGCVFEPRVVGARIGQTLEFRNSDPLAHNVRSASAVNNAFNISQPFQDMVSTVELQVEEGMLRIKCDSHRWMTEYIGVVDHPFFAVSDQSGAFQIEGVPEGTHVLEAWHEEFGLLSKTVSVETGTQTAVDLSYGAAS